VGGGTAVDFPVGDGVGVAVGVGVGLGIGTGVGVGPGVGPGIGVGVGVVIVALPGGRAARFLDDDCNAFPLRPTPTSWRG